MAIIQGTKDFGPFPSQSTAEEISFILRINDAEPVEQIAFVAINLNQGGTTYRRYESPDDIDIDVANKGRFAVKEHIPNIPCGTYEYDCLIRFNGGKQKHYLKGNWQISDTQTPE